MLIIGEEGVLFLWVGIFIGDLGGGLFVIIGIFLVLNQCYSIGCGQYVDILMQDCQIFMFNYMVIMYLMSGVQLLVVGNSYFVYVFYGIFKICICYLIFVCMGDVFYLKLVYMLDDFEFMLFWFVIQLVCWVYCYFINEWV